MFRIQFEVNRKWFGHPKVSSFPYTEGPEKFGCTAGILHSFITARGELTPCDFIPLSFGNVVQEGVAHVYSRMRKTMGEQPRMRCMSFDIKEQLVGLQLPVRGEEAARIATHAKSSSYPRFFRDLQED
jgi:MoaA/NifB/PqqE/SkfB family radical SAM enzyme